MTPVECVRLVKFVAARCPAMRMQDDTPEAWYVDLVEFDLTDALEAARRTTLAKTFIGIGDLVDECRAIVRKREGERRLAQIEAEVLAENPPTAAVTDKARPLAALLVGTSIRTVSRGGYDGPTRKHRDSERMAQARAEVDSRRVDDDEEDAPIHNGADYCPVCTGAVDA